MTNDIINGVASKLNQVFGSAYRIYKESIKQGFKEPCFYVSVLNPSQSAKLPNRYFRSYPFVIQYFPKSVINARDEMYYIAETLLLELEYITVKHNGVDNLIRGVNIRYELVDDVLHFFVNYDFFIKKQADEVNHMETLESNSTLEE